MDSFVRFIAANGIIAPDHIAPGKWVRCRTTSHPKKKNGSIKLADDGLVGWCQDYAVHAEPVLWRANDDVISVTPIDRAAIARRNAERRAALIAATLGAREYYGRCTPLQYAHPYLVSKGLGVAGCHGLRVDAAGALVVPMLYNGKILSLQRIAPDGEKKFHFGATTKGAYYAIDRPGATLTALAEGFATGLTIFHAIPSSRVLVAFNAGNLPVVAETVARFGMGVVCGDNDWETHGRIGANPGLDAAHKAAEILNVGVAYPTCAGSDWNDYLMERIESVSAEQNFSFSRKQSILQIQAGVFAEIKFKVMREARLLRTASHATSKKAMRFVAHEKTG
jgi:putative DNA primase/helicase